jgi:riboflavin synthase alpha subunit
MFTGLIEATGRVESIGGTAAGRQLRVATPLGGDVAPGDSVAVNGVCLTVTTCDAAGFAFDVSPETLQCTSLGSLQPDRVVNLERPLRADGRVGGHFVQGHVDGVGSVRSLREDGGHRWIEVGFPPALASNFVLKGSVAVDGVSLTVASLAPDRFGVQIIPFTWEHTAFPQLRAGDVVNLEVDMLGKYVLSFLRSA